VTRTGEREIGVLSGRVNIYVEPLGSYIVPVPCSYDRRQGLGEKREVRSASTVVDN